MGGQHQSTRLLVLLVVVLFTSHAQAALDNVITQWVGESYKVISTVGIQNQLATKHYTLLALATHQSLQKGGAPEEALAAFAGHAIVSSLYPWNQGTFDVLIAKQLAKYSTADLDKAEAVAVPIAHDLLRSRVSDGSTRWARFKPAAPGTPYAYQYLPGQVWSLYPQLATTKPFLSDPAVLRAITSNRDPKKGPVFLPSKTDYAPTFQLGRNVSAPRSQYDKDTAFFWALGSNTSSVIGIWLEIAREVLPPNYSLKDTALFYVRAGITGYDSAIAGWQVKYSTLHWRPTTAARLGSPGFPAIPDWTPLIPVPNHPEYPSGHTLTGGALLEVLLYTLGKDKVTFGVGSGSAPWVGKRTYNSLTAAALEGGVSRKFGGVHFDAANNDGLTLGRLVAKQLLPRIK